MRNVMKRSRSLAFALLVATTPLTMSAPVFAQAAPDEATTKAARARFQEGVEFYDKGQFENARAAFLQAYALRKHPAVLLNLAQSSLHSNHQLEAAKFFSQYLHESSQLTPAQKNDAQNGLADARQKLGRIEVTAPAGTEIAVDGQSVGTAPLAEAVDVDPGPHTVKGRGDDIRVSVMAGQVTSAKFGTATSPAALLPSGEATTPPTDAAPEPPKVTAPPADDSSKPGLFARPETISPVIIGGIVSLGGFATAIAFLISKSNAQNSANSVAAEIRAHGGQQGSCTDPSMTVTFGQACSALNSDDNAVNSDATLGNIGLGVGIAGAVFSLGYYMFATKHVDDPGSEARPKTNAPTVAVTPLTGPHLSGLSLTGTF
jgi:hypothetical protein